MVLIFGGGAPEYARPLQEIKLNQEFVWEELSGFIPAVYSGSKGMVIDFCIRVSNEAVQQFLDKWECKLGNRLSEEEQEALMEENPLTVNFNLKVTVNGEELENELGCGTSYSRIVFEKYHSKERQGITEEERLAQEYGCDDTASWCFVRHSCRWEKKPDRLESLVIDFIAERKPYAAEKIETDADCGGKIFSVVHPLTGETYELKVYGTEQNTLNPNIWKEMKGRNSGLEYPTQYLALSYELTGELAEEEFRLQDCGRGDRPRGLAGNQAAGVSVIGGSSGPVSVFVAGKAKDNRRRTALSELYFSLPEKLVWKPVFMEKERTDMRLHIEMPSLYSSGKM